MTLMAEKEYDHVDPRTDAEVARDEAKGKKAPDAKNKARTVTEPEPIKSPKAPSKPPAKANSK